MIKHISFDFWNTLFISFDKITQKREYERLQIFMDFASRNGVNISESQTISLNREVWSYFDNIWSNDWRTPLASELLDFMCAKWRIKASKDDLSDTAKSMGDLITEYPPILTDRYLLDIIPALSREYELSIISDTGFSPGIALRKVLEIHGLLEFFSEFAFSDEVGHSKPHKIMFHTVIGDSSPDTLVHVGDIGSTDIKGAKSVGANAVRYTRYNDSPSSEFKEDFTMPSWDCFTDYLQRIT